MSITVLFRQGNNSGDMMKVVLVNGSPNKYGCTHTALKEIASSLHLEGIETEIFWIKKKPLSGCTGCGHCAKAGKCTFDDSVNEFLELAESANGFIFGSPVHYAAASGAMTCFMDRAFFANHCGNRNLFHLKPAAAIVTARRAGATATLDQLNKYFLHAQMPIVSSRYWNMVHGNTPEEVLQDFEGLQIIRVLGKNMAWLMKSIKMGRENGIMEPDKEQRISTNFIRK